jgi:hypothetical protein
VLLERPVTAAEIDREADRMAARGVRAGADLESLARTRAERVRRLRFHVAAWLLAMIVVTPLNALIEWQDNGAFERFSRDSQPGSWDPWVLYVGGIWALVVAVFALWVYFDRPRKRGTAGGDVHRLTPSA